MLPHHSDTIAQLQHEERLRQAEAGRRSGAAPRRRLRHRIGAVLIRTGVALQGRPLPAVVRTAARAR